MSAAATTVETPLPEGWIEKKDEKTGKSYYYNKTTKETSWKRPAPDPNALPEGWVEKKDEKSGKNYYYNKTTKETSWTRPASPFATPAAADPDALPEGWVEKKDEKAGKSYYYNKTTKETTWTRPGSAATTPSAADADPNALPDGWVEKKDDKSGKNYYYNKTTKETSWTRPGSAASTPAAGDPTLPDGWVEKKDEKSGKNYYYNKTTKETSWTRPGSAAATPAHTPAATPSEKENADPKPPVAAPAVAPAPVVEEKKAPAVVAKWVPPPPPAAMPPPPPSTRNPALLGGYHEGGSSRSSSHMSNSSDPGMKSNGWRNFSKAQWLEELEKRMGASTQASRQMLLEQKGAGVSTGTSTASPVKAELTEKELMRLAAQGVTISAQETLQELTAKKGEKAASFVDFRDGSSQTVFGAPTADVAIATLHAASNIVELVPIPDAGNLSCATLESLRREQDKALTLLQHVQGTLASQMQEAGVAFAGHGSSRQLRLNIQKKPSASAKGEENETAALAKELGPAYRSLHAPASTGVWRFATEHDSNSLYDNVAVKKAAVVEQLLGTTTARHELFDRIEADFVDHYELREKMWTEYARCNANSQVDVADFVLRLQQEQLQRRSKRDDEVAANARHRSRNDDE